MTRQNKNRKPTFDQVVEACIQLHWLERAMACCDSSDIDGFNAAIEHIGWQGDLNEGKVRTRIKALDRKVGRVLHALFGNVQRATNLDLWEVDKAECRSLLMGANHQPGLAALNDDNGRLSKFLAANAILDGEVPRECGERVWESVQYRLSQEQRTAAK